MGEKTEEKEVSEEGEQEEVTMESDSVGGRRDGEWRVWWEEDEGIFGSYG